VARANPHVGDVREKGVGMQERRFWINREGAKQAKSAKRIKALDGPSARQRKPGAESNAEGAEAFAEGAEEKW
jgi:hypothetical protein